MRIVTSVAYQRNRTIIEAHANQAMALARVIQILEKDGVPRSAAPSADALFKWQRAFGRSWSELRTDGLSEIARVVDSSRPRS
jgi:hypothetical protein